MDSAHRDDGESLPNFRGSEIQGDWRFLGHPSDQMGYSSSSAMVATFGTTLNPQTAMAEIRAGLASQSGGGIFPQNPRQLSTEPSFGQWAPRPSSFPGFSSSPSSGAAMAIPVEDFQRRNPKNDGGHEGENRAEGNHEEDPGSSPGSINRKRKWENPAADEGKNSSAEPPPKEDYVHVRARRGQATNSHSLAERVRREKISERMKFLQDLVPGCSKVTGKALMLDEIINYVQSLQRQVEFLSMKLATVNPPFDFNIDGMFLREISSIAHAQFMNAALQPANQTASWPDELLNFHGGHLKAQR